MICVSSIVENIQLQSWTWEVGVDGRITSPRNGPQDSVLVKVKAWVTSPGPSTIRGAVLPIHYWLKKHTYIKCREIQPDTCYNQGWAFHNLSWEQCCQPVQIICICPDICAFSVLDNRHCADICAFCQKCQFEVEKGRQVLLLQSKADDMHCKQADSATLKYPALEFKLLVHAVIGQIPAFVANRILSRIRAFLGLFCPDLYADI